MSKKLLRKKLALMFANLKKKRRYYCEVEYLQSTGTQYIDTGVYPTQLTEAEYRCAVTGSVANVDSHLFGSRLSASSEAFDLAYMNTTPNGIEKFRFVHGTTTTQETTTSVTASQLANPHTYYMSGTSFKVDGSEKMSFTTASFTGSYSLWLFGVNSAGSLHNQVRAQRVYKCKIWDNGVLVRDFIPVLDWDMTPCMYDRVTEQLFYNAGTGNFTYGREIHPVEYLESTGTQYIDTGVKLTNNHSVELDYELTNASQSRAGLFGALNMTGSNQGRFGSLLSPSNRYLEHGYGSGNDYWQQGLPDTKRHKLYQKKNELYFDGTLIHTFNTATFSLAINAYLGNFVYTNYTPALAKYYGSRWWDGDTLIREYSPAIDENGVGFWFDKVSHTIYDNAGTGAFKYPAREVEYLESTGTQYIDTGITINTSTDEVVIDFQLISTTLYQWIMGEHDNGARFGIGVGDGTNKRNIAYGVTTYKVQDDQVYNEKHNFKANSNGVFLNDVQIHGYENFASASTVYLFKLNLSGSNGAAGKIWNYKHKRNGTLARDFVPAFKDGSSGMLDKVNNVFYTNAGTGTFNVGKIVESRYE